MSWCVLAYAYRTVSGNRSSAQVEFRNVRNSAGTLLEGKKYTYDALGNITMISQSTGSYYPLVAYEYDAQSQLVKETYYNGNGTGSSNVTATYTYTYDTAGNISSAVGDGMTISYTYDNTDWVDLLTSVTYNGTKKSISYDAVGNPMNWYNGTVYTALTWTQGRRLSSLKKGSTSISYAYDMDGVRTTKIAGNEKHEYVTQNGKVVRELVTNKTTGAFIRCLDFLYDESGKPFAMRRYWDASLSSYGTYHYVLNAQGDVVQINYQGGEVKATYTYDAWGRVLTADGELAAMNPLRYRGYYYDTDTGFYYLQSRYYDPIIKRFLNADALASTGQGFTGNNMFVYCGNNPVCMADSEGTFPEYVIVDTSKTTTAEMITNDEGDTIYRTTITFYEKVTIKSFRWTIYESSYTHTRTYEYTVTNNGIIRFDNTQKHADDVTYSEIGLELSKEMLRVAREKLPGALEGRTEQGIENELCAHYLLSGINNHAKIADMGSSKKRAVGYDSNAWLFELF